MLHNNTFVICILNNLYCHCTRCSANGSNNKVSSHRGEEYHLVRFFASHENLIPCNYRTFFKNSASISNLAEVRKKWLLNTGKISAENAEQMGIILKEKYPEKSKDVDLWCDWFSGKSFLDIDTMNKNLFAFTLFAQQCKENTYAFEIIRAIVFNQFKKYLNAFKDEDKKSNQKENLLQVMQSSPLFASYFKPSGVLSGIKIAVFTAADVFPNYSKEFESMEKEIRPKLASPPHPLTNS